MYPVLQVGDVWRQAAERLRKLTEAEVLPLLAEYQLLPLLVKEMIIDEAIAQIECTNEEVKLACEQLAQQYKQQAQSMNAKQMESLAVRQFKLEKFKQTTWGGDLESYFIQRKPQLNRVVYSLISTKDIGIAQELYFRIQEGEQSFAQLAREYAHGPEAETDGLVGPVELQGIHPALAKLLSMAQPQQLLPPTQLGDWIVIVRLEKLLPAKLDRFLSQRLLNERFNAWLQTQLAAENWQINQL
ncbi:MAG: peptidylprolyl isomerase [Heteroscytonema crispum UTEX LB 1556]